MISNTNDIILKTTNLMLTLNINHRLTKHHNSFVSRFTAMQPSHHLASHHIDSGFSDDEHWSSTSRTESLTSSDQHSSANNIDQSDQKDYKVVIASNDDFGEYVEMSLDSEKAPSLPKRRGENPSKPPTELHQLAPQGIEQRIVGISLDSEKALPLPIRRHTEDANPSKPPTERHQLDSQVVVNSTSIRP